MKHAQSIRTQSWKGRDVAVALEGLNVIVGTNGSGKTALLEAMRFACTGKTSVGGTNDATAQHVGHNGGDVSVTLSDGFAWTRSIVRDHETATVSQRCTVHDGKRRRLNEAKALVSEHVGDFAPMFDLSEFLGLSADRRRDFVMSLCAEHGNVAETLAANIAAMAQGKLPGGPYDAEIVSDASGRMARAYKSAPNPVEGLSAALEFCRTEMNAAARVKDEGHQAARAISERRVEIAVASGTLSELHESAKRLDERVAELSGKIAESRGRAQALDSLGDQIRQHEADIASAEASIADIQAEPLPDVPEAARCREEVETLRAKAEATEVPVVSRETLFRAEEAASAADKVVGVAERNHETADFTLEKLRRRQQDAGSDPWRLAAAMLEEAMGEVEHDKLTELSHFIEKRISSDDPEALAAAIERAQSDVEDAVKAHTAADRVDAEATERVKHAESEHAAALKLREERQNAIITLNDAAVRLNQRADTIDSASDRRNAKLSELANRVHRARMGINDCERRIGELGGFTPATDVETAHAEAKLQRDAIRERIQAKGRADELDRELARVSENARQHEQRWRVYKHFGDSIRAARETIMAELVAPLLTRMDRFIAAAMPGYAAYCKLINERDKPIFEMGWSDGDTQFPFDTLPGGFKATFACALSYALVAIADVPMRIVLCEVAEVDAHNLPRLLDGFEAVADELSNVLLATHLQVVALTGWNVVRCDGVQADTAEKETVGA